MILEQLQYSKMLLVDLFFIKKTVFNDQKAQGDPRISVKQRQKMQTQIRRHIDIQSDQSIRVYNTVCTLLKQYTIVKRILIQCMYFWVETCSWQYLLQIILVTSWFDLVCIDVKSWVNFRQKY